MQINETRLRQMIHEGCEFTFDRPDSPAASWGTVDFSSSSYMGLKLFLSNKETKMMTRLRGVRSPDGKVTEITVVRD